MKTKQPLLSLLNLLMFACLALSLNAQVTFGLLEKPVSGALLQLKNIADVNDDSANANKGLLLPKVMLSSITDLFPMFPIDYEKEVHDLAHTGLIVYNVNENLFNGDGAGLYSWDGTKWHAIGLTPRNILAHPTELYISERNPTMDAVLTTTPIGLRWSVSMRDVTNSSDYTSHTKDGKHNLTFKRSASTYGNKSYIFTLDNSSKNASIKVHHINLSLNKDLLKVGENSTIFSSSIVNAEGGDADWLVKDYTRETLDWVVPPHNNDGFLSFEVGVAKQPGIVEAYITVAHINDPEYTKVITIQQNKDYIVLPEFDYLVIQYIYGGKIKDTDVDLDTATEFTGTGVPNIANTNNGLDNNPAGWNVGRVYQDPRKVKNMSFMHWAGDNRKTGYEAVYANMSIVRDDILTDDSPREFNVDMYATWYAPSLKTIGNNNKITINITLYKGGKMEQYNTYDYRNIGGKEVFKLSKTDLPVTTHKGVNSYKTLYTKMLRLEYDRLENTGVLLPLISPRAARFYMRNDNIPFDMLSNETKDEYAKRSEEYREQVRNSIDND